MNRASAIVILMLAGVVPVFARLGETPEQCEARYGKAFGKVPMTLSARMRAPDGTMNDAMVGTAPIGDVAGGAIDLPDLSIFEYKKSSLVITIYFVKGHAVVEQFQNSGGSLDELQIQTLLDAEVSDQKWTKKDNKYTRDDNTVAYLLNGDSNLVFISPDWAPFVRDALAKATDNEKKSLEGF